MARRTIERNRRISTRLLLIVTIVCGIPIAVYFLTLYRIIIPWMDQNHDIFMKELEIRTRELHLAAGHEISSRIEELLETAKSKLTPLSEGASFANLPLAARQQVLETMYNNSPEFARLILFDAVAQQIYSAYSVTEGGETDLGSAIRQLNLSVQIPDQLFYSQVYTNSNQERILLGIGVPFRNPESTIAGFIWGEVDLTYLANFIADYKVGSLGSITVVDSQGLLIFAQDLTAALARTDVSTEPLPQEFLQNLKSGLLEFEDKAGKTYVGTYQRFDELGWGILTEEPWEVAFMAAQKITEKNAYFINKIRWLGFVSTSLVFFSIMFLSLHLRSTIRVPLKRLENALIDLADGDLTGYVRSGNIDEIGRVIDVYNRVVKRIRETWGKGVVPKQQEPNPGDKPSTD